MSSPLFARDLNPDTKRHIDAVKNRWIGQRVRVIHSGGSKLSKKKYTGVVTAIKTCQHDIEVCVGSNRFSLVPTEITEHRIAGPILGHGLGNRAIVLNPISGRHKKKNKETQPHEAAVQSAAA